MIKLVRIGRRERVAPGLRQRQVLKLLRVFGMATIAELARNLHANRVSVHDALRQLLRTGRVMRSKHSRTFYWRIR
jgi:predicted transcriptional regulator